MGCKPSKKAIAIIGATGNQGGGLMRAILKDPKCGFIARAITRDPSSEKAQNLKKMGVEVVQADLSNEAALTKAIEGCYGMYCVTTFDLCVPENEMKSAKIMASAAKKVGIKHVIWSTLEDTRKLVPLEGNSTMPTLMGKYKVPHMDVKAEADAFFADLPTTYLLTSFYFENFTTFFPPKKGPDGKLYLTVPMGKKRLPAIATEDIGKCAYGIFKRSASYISKHVGIAGESLTMAEFSAKMSKALCKEIAYNEISFDEFRKIPFPMAKELGNMFQYNHDYEKAYSAARSIDESRKLNPELMTFDQWLAKNKHRIPLP